MATSHNHVSRILHEDEVSRIDAASSSTGAEADSSGAPSALPTMTTAVVATNPSPVFVTAPTGSAVETLLLIPYACVLLEFVAAFDLGEMDNHVVRDDLNAYMHRALDELCAARELCVELQRDDKGDAADAEATASPTSSNGVTRDVKAASAAATNTGDAFQVYTGLHFSDVFRSARYPIASRLLYLTPQTPVAMQQRIFAEWCYLLHIYALKCTAILGSRSVLLQACSTRELVDLLKWVPSALEEGAIGEFLSSCWEEMNLHCSMPPNTCVELCTSVIVSRV